MNEALFFLQTLLIIIFAFGALKLGKGALTAWVAIQAVIANLFVLKQIKLFGFDVTASDAFAIGSLLGINFLQEFFSREDANLAAKVCFYFMLFFALVSQLHLLYQPAEFDTTQSAFQILLSPSPRLFLASMGTFLLVQQVDIRFFQFLKKKFSSTSFSTRTAITLLLSQLLDTAIFSFAGLYGLVISIADIIVVSLIIKLIVILYFTFFMKHFRYKS